MKDLITYFSTFFSLLIFDGIWLMLVAKNFYAKHLASFLSGQVNWLGILLFYPLYAAGILIFAILPAARDGEILKAILLGGFLGMIAYGTYNFTNLATLKNWPLIVVIIDVLWGMLATALAAGVGVLVFKKL